MTKIIAHRGYSKNHPENTLSAFKAAISLGADGIELDIHETNDGELIVHHDYYLGNPDNGQGLIFQQNSTYIKGLRIGQGERIPTLEEVFKLVGADISYEIELKGFTPPFIKKVVALAKRFGVVNNIEFTSPLAYNLTKIKEIFPISKTGYFASVFPDWMDKELGRSLLVNNALLGNINVLHCPLSVIDEPLVVKAHQNGLKIHAADCNTEEDLQRAMRFNIDQLSTNNLELALLLRDQSRADW